MRPPVLGRKNWIHVGSVEAGPKVVESCRRMGIPVRQYLLRVLPGMGDRKVSEVAAAAGLAEFKEIRKAGDGRTRTLLQAVDLDSEFPRERIHRFSS